ncbi:nucleotidyltransferase domain-containing protein [Candidatus Woesearchaeota archaeon]|nr:nucleotidyltransferase domain-containing protein [Candidatus Woesearchaeota archaeon]
MLKQDELKVLMVLFDDLTKDMTLSDIARALKQKYPQTYKIILGLEKKQLLNIKTIGKSKVVTLDFEKDHPEYIIAEVARTKNACKNSVIRITKEDVTQLQKNVICILFGSYANNTQKKESDVDLLFVIPEEFDYGKFDTIVRNKIILYNPDINIGTEQSLFEMWQYPNKLNVGNEILKKHIILYGTEHYLTLLRKHYVG